MAKRDEEKANGSGRVKFRYADGERYFDLDVDGIKNEGGVVEGLKSIASAIAGRNLAPRTLTAKPATNGGAPVGPPPVEEPLNEPEDGEPDTRESVGDTNGNDGQKTRKKQVPKAPTLLSDLDLSIAKIPLQDFVAAKDPTTVNDKYVVLATWFKEQMNLQEINIDHIFTAFRALNWSVPDDLSAVFRTLKHSKQYFDKGEGIGGYKVTFLATNYVAKMGTTV